MEKSVIVHLKNVFVGAQISAKGTDVDVTMGAEHLLAIRDGRDLSKEMGATKEFSLSPIPKASRLYTVDKKTGNIVKHADFKERSEAREQFADESGFTKSIEQLESEGFEFDKEGVLVSAPSVEKAAVKKPVSKKK